MSARTGAAEATKNVTSPNDRPGIALIGCGGQGTGDAGNAARFGDIVAVCDVDARHADAAAEKFTRMARRPRNMRFSQAAWNAKTSTPSFTATPDHWHTLVNIAAAKARKDVYGEKPLTLTIDEGRHVVKAVRDNKIVFQTGTQQRSSRRFRLACELVRNGRIGKLQTGQRVCARRPARRAVQNSSRSPENLNWDFWLGQAPRRIMSSERCHATFRWWWDYSGGPVTDWGAHHNDIARWGIRPGRPSGTSKPRSLRRQLPGGYTTPSEFEATLTWANGVTQIVKTTSADSPFGAILKEDGQRNGVKFTGTDGWIWVNRDEITASDKDDIADAVAGQRGQAWRSATITWEIFSTACVRARTRSRTWKTAIVPPASVI